MPKMPKSHHFSSLATTLLLLSSFSNGGNTKNVSFSSCRQEVNLAVNHASYRLNGSADPIRFMDDTASCDILPPIPSQPPPHHHRHSSPLPPPSSSPPLSKVAVNSRVAHCIAGSARTLSDKKAYETIQSNFIEVGPV